MTMTISMRYILVSLWICSFPIVNCLEKALCLIIPKNW
jgi:hypothetical protein